MVVSSAPEVPLTNVLVGCSLRVLGDCDALVTGQRPDQDVGLLLLHQALGLAEREVGGVVRATDADDLDRMAVDGAALHALERIVLVHDLGAGQLDERHDRATDVGAVERGERALAVREDGDLDRRTSQPTRRWASRSPRWPSQAITSAASGSAYFSFRKLERFTFGVSFVSVRHDAWQIGRREARLVSRRRRRCGGRSGRTEPRKSGDELVEPALPDAEQAVGREQHDGEEDQADQRVERAELLRRRSRSPSPRGDR